MNIKYMLARVFRRFLLNINSQQVIRNISSAVARPARLQNCANPYLDITPLLKPSDSVFISGRFRSGSTMLWNIFRNLEGCTAYYEPLNERKWFLERERGGHTDATHLGVKDYWSEYRGLSYLDDYFDVTWSKRNLYMDENSWNRKMENYIQAIIDATQDLPVLQFNRVDFRLAWLRKHFPEARIIHIYRHPRDQWLSFLMDKKQMNKDDVVLTYRDSFYLNNWCSDLQAQFPFLDTCESPHPYTRFYYLWKLSYLHGLVYSDISVSFESIVEDPEQMITKILDAIAWSGRDIEDACRVVEKTRLNKWKDYADDGWFSEKEFHCETILSEFLANVGAEK